jgi:hypothetical protein
MFIKTLQSWFKNIEGYNKLGNVHCLQNSFFNSINIHFVNTKRNKLINTLVEVSRFVQIKSVHVIRVGLRSSPVTVASVIKVSRTVWTRNSLWFSLLYSLVMLQFRHFDIEQLSTGELYTQLYLKHKIYY